MNIGTVLKGLTKRLRAVFQMDDRVPEWADPRIAELNEEIDRVRGLLNAARNNFNFVTDPDAVEYYIYLQKAYEVRYDMLVRRLKETHGVICQEASVSA